MGYIYVLLLTGHKYYVGKTSNVNLRLQDHMNNNGSEWTRKYRPLEVISIEKSAEDIVVLHYMKEFGIDNVRGGSFTQMTLNDEEINVINKMFATASDECYRCGREGHYAVDCYAKTHKNASTLTSIIKTVIDIVISTASTVCYRCGRDSHCAVNCYARTHKNGTVL